MAVRQFLGRRERPFLMKLNYFLVFFIIFAFSSSFLLSFAETVEHEYQKRSKRDPFIPYVTNDGQLINIGTEDKEFSLKLEGIMYEEGGESLAIINGEVLKVNDIIADMKIIEIRKDCVVYMKNGELFIAEKED